MPIQIRGKSGVLAYFGPKIRHFGHIFLDMDFKFVLPCFIISIDIKGQTKLEGNWTQIDHFSLKKPQKWPYLEIQLAQVSITKKSTPPTFFHDFFKNFLKFSEST